MILHYSRLFHPHYYSFLFLFLEFSITLTSRCSTVIHFNTIKILRVFFTHTSLEVLYFLRTLNTAFVWFYVHFNINKFNSLLWIFKVNNYCLFSLNNYRRKNTFNYLIKFFTLRNSKTQIDSPLHWLKTDLLWKIYWHILFK